MRIDKNAFIISSHNYPEVGERALKIEKIHLIMESSERPGVYKRENPGYVSETFAREELAFDETELLKLLESRFYFFDTERDGYVLRYTSPTSVEIGTAQVRGKDEFTDEYFISYTLVNGRASIATKPDHVLDLPRTLCNKEVNVFCPTKEDLIKELMKKNRFNEPEKESAGVTAFLITTSLLFLIGIPIIAAIFGRL